MFGSVFLMNLLCAMVPCDYKNPAPEIEGLGPPAGPSNIMGYFRGKRLSSFPAEMYPVVQTGSGKVKGYPMMVMSGRKVTAFEGIPYADAAVRFQEAFPVKNWTGIREAFSPGPDCLQMHVGKGFRVYGSENCLTLNVFTPQVPNGSKSGKKFPTIVYIHGGSFAFGAGAEFGPSYLLQKDVVLVTLNYRLGVLGFLSTGDENSPGNLGLKDQALALKWVYENIQEFGGDSEHVTLMGQSAGAVSVHLHMLNSNSRKFFQKAVLMSGTAFNHWGLQEPEKALSLTRKLALLLNCPVSSSKGMLKCLQKSNPNWLVGQQMNLFDWMPFPPILFAPVIEPESPHAFISKKPEVLIGDFMKGEKIPAIFSITAQEGLLANYALNGMMKVGPFINDVKRILPFYLDYYYETDPSQRKEVTEKVLEYYVGKGRNPRFVRMPEYAEMGTDRMFGNGVHNAIRYHSLTGSPTYAGIFSYYGKYNMGRMLGVPEDEMGVAHTEDLYYIFNASIYLQGFKQKDKEAELSKFMVDYLINFVNSGEPSHTKQDGTHLKFWSPVSPSEEKVRFLRIDREIEMVEDPFVERRGFWESLGLRDVRKVDWEEVLESMNSTDSFNEATTDFSNLIR